MGIVKSVAEEMLNPKKMTHSVYFQGVRYVVYFGGKRKKKEKGKVVPIRPIKSGIF
jgi:hypothetical protein